MFCPDIYNIIIKNNKTKGYVKKYNSKKHR